MEIRRRDRSPGPRVKYPLNMPKTLSDQLEDYLRNFSMSETKNSIILAGLESELNRRYAEIYKTLRKQTKIVEGDTF